MKIKLKLGTIRQIIKETRDWRDLDASDEYSEVPPVGSWIMFQQHGRYRAEEPVKINAVKGDNVEVTWGPYEYSAWFPIEKIEFRKNTEILSVDDPRVIKSLEPTEEPNIEDVYGGDPKDRPWGLGS